MGSISQQTRHSDHRLNGSVPHRRSYDDNCCFTVESLPPNTSKKEIKALFEQFLDREETEVIVKFNSFKTHGNSALVVFPSAKESMNTAVSLRFMKQLEIHGHHVIAHPHFNVHLPPPILAKNINIAVLMNLSPETLMDEIRDACNCFVPEGDNIDIIFYRQHTKNSGRHNSYACLRFSSVAVCEHAMELSSAQRHTAVLAGVNTKILLKPLFVHQTRKLVEETTEWNVRVVKDQPHRCFVEKNIKTLASSQAKKL